MNSNIHGAGLGLRRSMIHDLAGLNPASVDFMEVAPENWIGVGGRFGSKFRYFTERFPFVAHGLSLSVGSPSPLDWQLLSDIKSFLKEHNIHHYSEHLSYCSDDGHLYDLMPIPFTEEAVLYTADRIRQVQDFLEQPISMENVSYYAAPQQEMTELEFIQSVIEEANCMLLLDVNNIYVNSINHRYDPMAFLHTLPADKISYIHVAGHYVEAEDLLVDTHGADVIEPVWGLLDEAYRAFGTVPTLLERDFNIPPLSELLGEMDVIRDLQQAARSVTQVSREVV